MTGGLERFQKPSVGQAPTQRAQNGTVIGVYKVTCAVNKKAYAGWSKNAHNRLGWHRSHLRNGNHPVTEMQADFITHAEDQFSFTLVKVCTTEEEAVKEEAILIGELFRMGLAYNRIVPNTSSAKVRAKKKHPVQTIAVPSVKSESGRLKQIYYGVIAKHKNEYLRSASAAWDVMAYLNYYDEEQFFLLVAAFLKFTGTVEAVMCLKAFDNAGFVHNIRIGVYEPFPCEQAKTVQQYIKKCLEERNQVFAREEYFARQDWLNALRTEAEAKERTAA